MFPTEIWNLSQSPYRCHPTSLDCAASHQGHSLVENSLVFLSPELSAYRHDSVCTTLEQPRGGEGRKLTTIVMPILQMRRLSPAREMHPYLLQPEVGLDTGCLCSEPCLQDLIPCLPSTPSCCLCPQRLQEGL